ncbi:hypothetical protein AKO1_001060 [Acrasis kona]|uniref:SWIM-type domain-containing protein n=1 Tax=Acrasis kona TaxID=1008807 RepID=A0AAW2ZRG7_9EUKA
MRHKAFEDRFASHRLPTKTEREAAKRLAAAKDILKHFKDVVGDYTIKESRSCKSVYYVINIPDNITYTLHSTLQMCDCADYAYHGGKACKHLYAVALHLYTTITERSADSVDAFEILNWLHYHYNPRLV